MIFKISALFIVISALSIFAFRSKLSKMVGCDEACLTNVSASCDKCGKTSCEKSCATNLAITEGEDKLLASCTLDASTQIKRGNEVIAKTFSKTKVIKELPDGYDMVFAHSHEMVAELNEIAAFERKCCATFTWEVLEEPAQNQVHLKVFGSDVIKKELGQGMAKLGLSHLVR